MHTAASPFQHLSPKEYEVKFAPAAAAARRGISAWHFFSITLTAALQLLRCLVAVWRCVMDMTYAPTEAVTGGWLYSQPGVQSYGRAFTMFTHNCGSDSAGPRPLALIKSAAVGAGAVWQPVAAWFQCDVIWTDDWLVETAICNLILCKWRSSLYILNSWRFCHCSYTTHDVSAIVVKRVGREWGEGGLERVAWHSWLTKSLYFNFWKPQNHDIVSSPIILKFLWTLPPGKILATTLIVISSVKRL